MSISYFHDIDDCIMAAYKYVGDTGNKLQNHFSSDGGDAVGVISDDGTAFMMWVEHHNSSSRRKLTRQIVEHKITIVDFINKQLLPFL